MKKLTLTAFIATLMHLSLATAYPAMVVCGGTPGNAAVELDNVTVERGGNYENQLVLRNSTIINDFVNKQAIYGGELNSKGEFVIEGLAKFSTHSAVNSIQSTVNNRYVDFAANSTTSYTLVIGYTGANFQNVILADFTFNDCQTLPLGL